MSHNREEEGEKGYTWEAGYADGLNIREVLEEDENGSIEKAISRLISEARKKQRATDKPARIRLGIMRHVYIVLDCSRFMASTTWLPSRLQITIKAVSTFLEKFFEQNPIAQIGLIACKDRKAERIASLTGNVLHLQDALRRVHETQCVGDFSLQNGLQLALANLNELPGHICREVIVLVSAFSTVDPGSIFRSIQSLKAANIRCCVVGMSAEVFIYKQLCKATNGRYDVAIDEEHLRLLLFAHTAPPPTARSVECNAVRIGFPPHAPVTDPSFCQCHPDSGPLSSRGFLCVQCGGRYCSLPAECRICRLTLVAAPQLARAFRHLLPLAAFVAVDDSRLEEKEENGKANGDSESPGASGSKQCHACSEPLEAGSAYECKECKWMFCFDCDLLLHESLNICPGCA